MTEKEKKDLARSIVLLTGRSFTELAAQAGCSEQTLRRHLDDDPLLSPDSRHADILALYVQEHLTRVAQVCPALQNAIVAAGQAHAL